MIADIEKLELELCQFIKDNLIAESVELHPETQLSDIGLDSFSTIEVVLFIERKFGVQLPDEVLTPDHIATVRAMAKCALNFSKS